MSNNKYNDDKNSKNSTMELYDEFRFMEGIDSLEKFKEVLKTKNFWADTWAINVIEKNLNIKTVILSEESFNLLYCHTRDCRTNCDCRKSCRPCRGCIN